MDIAASVVHNCIAKYLPSSSLKREPSQRSNTELLYVIVPLLGLLPDSPVADFADGSSILTALCAHYNLHDKMQQLAAHPELDSAQMEHSITLLEDALQSCSYAPARGLVPAPALEELALKSEPASRPTNTPQVKLEAKPRGLQELLEIFPDESEELLTAALKYFDGSVQQVTDAIFDNNLPATLRHRRRNAFDGDKFDTAVTMPASQAWRGKSSTDAFIRGDEGSTSVNVEHIIGTQWTVEEEDLDDLEYNDEYDDAFDEIPSFQRAASDDILGDSMPDFIALHRSSVPRAAAGEADQSSDSEEGESYSAPVSRGGHGKGITSGGKGSTSGGKGSTSGGKGRSWRGAGKGQTQANQKKERHKAQFANHNRRKGADKKMKAGV